MTQRKDADLVQQAREALTDLGFEKALANERSALTLLGLLGMTPEMQWKDATRELRGVTELMNWMAAHFGKEYAPNSRETVRRFSLHQFVEAGLAVRNPDNPQRPINSPDTCYQIDETAYELLRAFGKPKWEKELARYIEARPGLQATYAAAREQTMVPVALPNGKEFHLTPGGQNQLIRDVIEVFCPRWTPGGLVLYVGDAGKEDPIYDKEALANLGVSLDKHGKFPDLIVHLPDREWLVLLEAASSHGPVDGKRHRELGALFAGCTAGLVYVSCFPDRATLRGFLAEIAWETEAWCADAPSHLIHFNGERFLGPYESVD
jgi:hypothetical protein